MELGKTMIQIAKTCNVTIEDVQRSIRKQHIAGRLRKENNKRYFDLYEQKLIYSNLYFELKSEYEIIESRMNYPD